MSFDVVIGGDVQPTTGFDVVISSADPGGSMLDVVLPSATSGAVFLIVVIRDGVIACSDATWTKVLDGVGGSGLVLDAYVRAYDGTTGSNEGDVVSFVSLSEQELQGGLVTLRYADVDSLIYHAAHAAFAGTTTPATPSVDADAADDLALCIWSSSGALTVVAPAGFRAIDSYNSSSVTPRTIGIATRRARDTGPLSLESPTFSGSATGRAFTLALHYEPPPGGFSHWGPQFPDQARPIVTKPATAAALSLADPVTISSALQDVVIRARAAGIAGNLIRFNIDLGTLSDTGEIQESGNDVTLFFNDGDLAIDIFDTINSTSTLVEAVGFVNPSETMIAGEDNFDRVGGPGAFIDLEGGRDARVGRFSRFFGPHFPSTASIAAPAIPPATPEGAATLALRLDGGLKVTYAWSTDVFKSYDGKEQRAGWLDDPRETYAGTAVLADSDALSMRGVIARHVANGATFLIGLPHEQTAARALGSVLTLDTPTASLDWAVLGQRVLVLHGAGVDIDSAEGVIQAVDTNSITLDSAPGISGVVMPLVPVLLEPEQSFARHRVNAERWQVAARAAIFGFPSSPAPGELTKSLGLMDVTFRAETPGVEVGLQFEVSGVSEITFGLTADEDGNFDLAIEVPTGTTLGELSTALTAGGLIAIVSSFDPDAVILGFEGFALTPFVGALPATYGVMGRGATVTQLLGRPLWDRKLENPSTITDSIHSLTAIEDLGARPFVTVEATVPDWGRHIRYTKKVAGADWQWFKAFLSAVKGQWKSFWLPTGRADLVAAVDVEGGTLDTLVIDAAQGSYELWSSRGYSVLEVVQGGVSRFVQVTSDSSDGTTFTLGLDGDLVEGPVDCISWCELVHLESDEVDVAFDSAGNFQVAMTARVVQQ